MKKVLLIFGTRPEAIKMAPMIKELQTRKQSFDVRVCVTGQHREMLDQVLDFFAITPDYDLAVMQPGQTLFGVTAKVLEKLEPVVDEFQPDIILVQGDTTSAFVGALAGYYKQTTVGHLEAGLRSGDIYSPFPEEMNRVMVGRIATYHFAPTERAAKALLAEGVPSDHIFKVGNTVIDALLLGLEIIKSHDESTYKNVFEGVDWSKKLLLVTGHRRESFGEGFESMCHAIKRLATENSDIEIVYPVHLNPNVQEPVRRILGNLQNVHLIAPLDYPQLIWLMEKAYLVLTDSGGIQEEAPTLGKPVLVMRNVTERQEGVEAGTAKLVGTDGEVIYRETQELLANQAAYAKMANAINPYGDGTTARQIADILEK
ncbi:MAG TPA: UDP-N-acetylglucosamine 2-epimerase (non-hydrolyzing) [Verrucomicrobiae bacterium]|nr:UDP-N-acetylglucosamine 2-epimerase (non-hydrolyzing) [Verrucomicrobiae bacterium]